MTPGLSGRDCLNGFLLLDFDADGLFVCYRPSSTNGCMDECASMQGGAVESGSKPGQPQTSPVFIPLNLPDTGTDAVVIASV